MKAEHVGKIIHFHRKKSGLSQERLGKIAGVGKTVIFDIEKGKLSVRFESILKVLHVLNIKIEFQSQLMPLYTEGLIMKRAKILVNNQLAGELLELERGIRYCFVYIDEYKGQPVSLTMPIKKQTYFFDEFPSFFEGLLPEGMMLEGLLCQTKLDRNDLMGQLITVGGDLVGNVTVEEIS